MDEKERLLHEINERQKRNEPSVEKDLTNLKGWGIIIGGFMAVVFFGLLLLSLIGGMLS